MGKHTKVVNCKVENFDIFIGRPSKWGNPFKIGKDGNREEVIKKYEEWILTQKHLLKALKELKNKRLGCFCFPKQCHGNVLVTLIRRKYGYQTSKNIVSTLSENI